MHRIRPIGLLHTFAGPCAGVTPMAAVRVRFVTRPATPAGAGAQRGGDFSDDLGLMTCFLARVRPRTLIPLLAMPWVAMGEMTDLPA